VLRIKGTRRGIALKVDSNPRACALDPYLGTIATVCEAVRNVACTGAHPAGITNCLNYGNPERPEIMWQFIKGIEGLRDAALAFDLPVVSGNVSFYNETEGHAIPPTPTIAVVGILDDIASQVKHCFSHPGDLILMVRTATPSLLASEYAALFGESSDDQPGQDKDHKPGSSTGEHRLVLERRLMEGLIDGAGRGLIRSAHDVSEGGIVVTLAEACFNPARVLGAEVEGLESDTDLFGEGPSTVVLSAAAQNLAELRKIFQPLDLCVLGRVSEIPRLRVNPEIDEDANELLQIYEQALPRRLSPND
jgi:phosphoribosylformylglycinamidine synthase